MAWYRARYKCRLCGQVFGEERTAEKWEAFTDVTELATTGRAGSLIGGPYPQMVHICKSGSYGMADFIGMEKVET